MKRDKLLLLHAGFKDPAFPNQVFYCWHCALMEGVLGCYPILTEQIDIERISWARPRQEIARYLGPENQSLPVLILADDAPAGLETGNFKGWRFVDEKDAILRAFSARYGIARPHP